MDMCRWAKQNVCTGGNLEDALRWVGDREREREREMAVKKLWNCRKQI